MYTLLLMQGSFMPCKKIKCTKSAQKLFVKHFTTVSFNNFAFSSRYNP